ncbi:MAG: alpha-E domain-containing protein [Anaerolineae bacterium]|jgi:uncharacterized alpha-E superfamily protein|nr:alpha-E domain-containing protein [Anaerolineae bacterium]
MLSRVADSLYWMSRYLERAEHTARVVDVHLNITLEDATGRPPVERWSRVLKGLHYHHAPPDASDYTLTYLLTFDQSNSQSVVSCIAAARENARQIREQLSSEMWMQINRLYLDVQRTRMPDVWNGQPNQFYATIKDGCHLFQGITATTLIRNEGWHFITLGRYLERTTTMIDLLAVELGSQRELDTDSLSMEEYFEWMSFLKFFTAFEAYCKVYNADLRADRILRFLLFNNEFPHSVRFCVEQVHIALEAIAQETGLHRNSRLHRLIGRLRSTLSYDEIDDVLNDFRQYLDNINEQCSHIHNGIYDTYIYRPVDSTF